MVSDKVLQHLDKKIEAFRIRDKDADDYKTVDEVFDNRTLLAIYKLMTDEVFDTLDFPLSTGKEGNVFHATNVDKMPLAVKIYRTNTATFQNLAKYIIGDQRFKGIERQKAKLVYVWAKKEYANLERMRSAGARVPETVAFNENILVMEYIGDDEGPCPMLKDIRFDSKKEAGKVYEKIINDITLIYTKGGLVHGDLSEYNVLMHGEKYNEPVLIDVGQSMLKDHPLAPELLERDIENITKYFNKIGLKHDAKEILASIKSKEV